MWNELSAAWQAAFSEAWAAFQQGSIPIGAVICDQTGSILICEHNRTGETGIANRKIAHAEANALRGLDTAACNPEELVLYTTMEPCPMCMGTAVMSNIRHLRYAAHDPYCGCVHWKDSEPYLRRKQLDYVHTGQEPEFVQLVMQSYFELRRTNGQDGNPVLAQFRARNAGAVRTAENLFEQKALDRCAADHAEAAAVYDMILSCAAAD